MGWKRRGRRFRYNSGKLLESFCPASSHVPLLSQKNNQTLNCAHKAEAERVKDTPSV